MSFGLHSPVSNLPALAARYDFDDDSAQAEAGSAARARGYYTRGEVVVLARWKTPRSQSLVAKNTPGFVEAMTGASLTTRDERERLAALTALSGVEVPTASVLLHFAYPERYPIIDWRALEALGESRSPPYSFRYWSEYVNACRELANQAGLTMRDLDKALWQWSREQPSSG